MPYILPQPPVRQTGWDQAGFATGLGVDLLLKALLSGKLGMPTPSQNAPPGMQGPVTQSGQFYPQPQVRPPMRIGPFEVKPDLTRQAQQADIDYKRSQIQMNTPENQADLIRRVQGLPPLGQTGSQPDVAKLQSIADAADAGDAQAKAFMDYYLSR